MKALNRSTLFVFGVLMALTINFHIAEAAPERLPTSEVKTETALEMEKIVSAEDLAKLREPASSPAEAESAATSRMDAINQALEKALSERAKSETAYERQIDRLAARPKDRSLEREQFGRELREETRREKRLNWLND